MATVQLFNCPDGYCCQNLTGCAQGSNETCRGNRDKSYPLCGGCRQGYSQCVDSLNCVADSQCGGGATGFFVFSQLVYWLVYDLYTLFQAKYMPLLLRLQWLPEKHRPSTVHTPRNGAIDIVIFFFQLAQVVVPTGRENLAAGVYAFVGQLFSLQDVPHSSTGGTCVLKGTRQVDVLTWQLCGPLMPAILLLFVGAFADFRSKRNTSSNEQGLLLGEDSNEPLLHKDETDNRTPSAASSTPSTASNIHSISTPSAAPNTRANNQSFARAVAGLGLLGYASLSHAALKLLRCQPVGNQVVLFYAGETDCHLHYAHWQAAAMLLFVVLVLLPLLPICVWILHTKLPPSWWVVKWVRGQRWQTTKPQLVIPAIKQYATEPFVAEHWHFAAVLALQRLSTVTCRTFAREAVEASLAVTMVSMCFLGFQMLARPYRVEWINALQLCASFCLVLLSILETVFSAFNSAAFTIEDSPLNAFGHRVSYFMAALLIPAPLFLVYGLLVYKDTHKRGEETTDNEVCEEHDNLEARQKRWGDEGLAKRRRRPGSQPKVWVQVRGVQRAPPSAVAAIPAFRPRGNKTRILHVSPRQSLTNQ
jgi:hypothetical protein